jgi:site-specific DNA recombinase
VPQELRRRQATLRSVRSSVARQRQRLLGAYLAEVIDLARFQRQDGPLVNRRRTCWAASGEVAAQGARLAQVSAIAQSMTAVLEELRVGLDQADFEQRRQLVELLIDGGGHRRPGADPLRDPNDRPQHQDAVCHLRTDILRRCGGRSS